MLYIQINDSLHVCSYVEMIVKWTVEGVHLWIQCGNDKDDFTRIETNRERERQIESREMFAFEIWKDRERWLDGESSIQNLKWKCVSFLLGVTTPAECLTKCTHTLNDYGATRDDDAMITFIKIPRYISNIFMYSLPLLWWLTQRLGDGFFFISCSLLLYPFVSFMTICNA